MTFDEAFDILMEHEGGYVNHPDDPGGETNWGVTKRVAEQEGYTGPMQSLPKDLAKDIYKRKYWNAVKADQLPEELRYSVFDAAVNSGPKRAIQWLQEVLGVGEDGLLGEMSLRQLSMKHPKDVAIQYNCVRLDFLTSLPTWKSFGKGWTRRVLANLKLSVQ